MQILGVVGHSDSGKTTAIEALVSRLAPSRKVATIKHMTHQANIDQAGKDTFRHRAAGSSATYGITEDGDWFATGETADLHDILTHLSTTFDVCLLEGFSQARLPSIVLGNIEYDGPIVDRFSHGVDVDFDAVVAHIDTLEPFVTLESLVSQIKESPQADRAGAIATFTGRVRTKDTIDDVPTEYLEFEYYEGVADKRLTQITTELEEREGVYKVLLHHRQGIIQQGQDIVFVVVLAGHREEAFRTVEDGINRLKAEVPIFKKEVTVEEEFWVHDRAEI